VDWGGEILFGDSGDHSFGVDGEGGMIFNYFLQYPYYFLGVSMILQDPDPLHFFHLFYRLIWIIAQF
jgi:hypothetical protein